MNTIEVREYVTAAGRVVPDPKAGKPILVCDQAAPRSHRYAVSEWGPSGWGTSRTFLRRVADVATREDAELLADQARRDLELLERAEAGHGV